jgi:plasmid stabilization system protein ParE
VRDLERLREFLQARNVAAAKRAARAIINAIEVLGQHPRIGRPVDEMAVEFRELRIGFGDCGYVALYRYEADLVIVLALRHQREAGY